jgi:hypothetical protein
MLENVFAGEKKLFAWAKKFAHPTVLSERS